MSIFHSKEFCQLHKMDLVNGIIPFGYVSNMDEWLSPTVGTFGGFCQSTTEEMQEAVKHFPHGTKKIKLAPVSHDPRLFSKSVSVLDQHGWKVMYGDINFDLEVDDKPLVKRMVSGHRKKLAKCHRAGFDVKQIPKDKWCLAYALVKDDRKRKGLKLSMSFDEIHRQESVLPDVCKMFGVFDIWGKMQAAAICMQIKPDVLYIFAWGDIGHNEYAPTITLASGIYEYCQNNDIPIMDIGIGTKEGVPNPGLIQFKENLGFKQSLKLTMRKDA